MDARGSTIAATYPGLRPQATARALLRLLREAPLFPMVVFTVLVLAAVLAPVLAPHSPTESNIRLRLLPPAWQEGGRAEFVLGTDSLGRDLLSRLIFGTRISLLVGVVVVFVSGAAGTFLGLISGYLGGWADATIMRFTDSVLALPFILLALVLAGVLGPSIANVVIILAARGWAEYARVLRGEVLRIREADFVKLAVVAGCDRRRIVARHIFPNLVNTLIVLATLQLGQAIIAEAALSFLGVGVPPPNPAWGLMAAEGRKYITVSWWLVTFPGLAIMVTVLAANFMGDWLRVRLDPKRRQV